MALSGFPDIGFIILEGRALHNITTNISHKVSQILEQTDGAGLDDNAWLPTGAYKFDVNIDGFYNLGAGLAQEGLELEGNQVLMYSLAGNAIGDPFTGIDGPHVDIETLMERGKLHRIKANFEANFGPEDMAQSIAGFPRNGLVQAGLQTVIAVGPALTASIDWEAIDTDYSNQETGSAIGFIGVTNVDIDGTGNIRFAIQDSDDNATWLDLIVFTPVTTAIGVSGERVVQVALAAPNDIERYTVLEYEYVALSGGNRTCTFACGLIRTLV